METQSKEMTQQSRDTLTQPSGPAKAPPVDVLENEDEILVVADLPGVTPDNLRIRLEGQELVIEGQQHASERKGLDFQPVLFRRSFVVPDIIDSESVSANLHQGVLNLHLKKSESAKPRKIDVKAG